MSQTIFDETYGIIQMFNAEKNGDKWTCEEFRSEEFTYKVGEKVSFSFSSILEKTVTGLISKITCEKIVFNESPLWVVLFHINHRGNIITKTPHGVNPSFEI